MTSRHHSPNLVELNLQPKLNQQLETVWAWLDDNNLTAQGRTIDIEVGSLDSESGQCYNSASVMLHLQKYHAREDDTDQYLSELQIDVFMAVAETPRYLVKNSIADYSAEVSTDLDKIIGPYKRGE